MKLALLPSTFLAVLAFVTPASIKAEGDLTISWSGYLNDYDDDFAFDARDTYRKQGAISGVESIHSNYSEDRIFNFRVSVPAGDPHFTERSHGNENEFDQESSVDCPTDYALTYIASQHSNRKEDRKWQYKCGHFEGWKLNECYWTGWVNEYDKHFKDECRRPDDVIAGMKSKHNSRREDRLFQFKCCEMTIARPGPNPPPNHELITSPEFTDYKNDYDGDLEFDALKENGRQGAISGISSKYNNRHKDRRFRFKVTGPSVKTRVYQGKYGDEHDFDQESYVHCPLHYALTYIASKHNNRKEDRKWEYRCAKFEGWKVDHCTWTPSWVNQYEKPFDFECSENEVIAGMVSKHDNHHEDRRFQFQCCKMSKDEEGIIMES